MITRSEDEIKIAGMLDAASRHAIDTKSDAGIVVLTNAVGSVTWFTVLGPAGNIGLLGALAICQHGMLAAVMAAGKTTTEEPKA